MPNFITALKEEIRRLAKSEVKSFAGPLKRDNVRLKRDNAALKRRVASLEKEARWLKSRTSGAPVKEVQEADVKKSRVSSRTVLALRRKMSLSQADFALLVGVHKNTVHFWESGRISPRGKSKSALVALKGVGAREAKRLLAEKK